MEYIEFVEAGESASGKTKRWEVRSRRSGDGLGRIEWYGPWRQYCFHTYPHTITVWNTDCLEQITAFIKGQMALREVNKAAKEIIDVEAKVGLPEIPPLPDIETAAKDCCGGEPLTCSTCETCGCVEGGNASFMCGRHQREQRAARERTEEQMWPHASPRHG